MEKGKYKKKRKKYQIDREIEDVCNRFEDADALKKDFEEVKKIVENHYFDLPKHFKETVAFTFYAKMIASTAIGMHFALRVLENKEAKEIDKILGYTTNYPKASADNTIKRPTQRNLKILMGIIETLGHRLKKFRTPWEDVTTNYRIDVNKHIIDSFELFGYHFEENETVLEETEVTSQNTPSDQETLEQENVVKISLNGETLFLPQNATMFEFLKAVKTRTEQEVTVTRMIETEIEL